MKKLISTREHLLSAFAGVVRRVEGPRATMSEAERQVEGLFESLPVEAFA